MNLWVGTLGQVSTRLLHGRLNVQEELGCQRLVPPYPVRAIGDPPDLDEPLGQKCWRGKIPFRLALGSESRVTYCLYPLMFKKEMISCCDKSAVCLSDPDFRVITPLSVGVSDKPQQYSASPTKLSQDYVSRCTMIHPSSNQGNVAIHQPPGTKKEASVLETVHVSTLAVCLVLWLRQAEF